MSLHWTIVAFFLYLEIAASVLLAFPYISNKRWAQIFKSLLFKKVIEWSSYVFNIMVVVLLVLFADAIREVQKYSKPEFSKVNLMDNLNTKDHVMMNMFRAQRNLYISGFALFLLLILKRMIGLITSGAQLEAQKEAAMKQAESASRTAQSLMDSGDADNSGDGDKKNSELEEQISKLKTSLAEARAEAKTAQASVEAMTSQSESLKVEYDRLSEEHAKLQQEQESVAAGDSKKDQ